MKRTGKRSKHFASTLEGAMQGRIHGPPPPSSEDERAPDDEAAPRCKMHKSGVEEDLRMLGAEAEVGERNCADEGDASKGVEV